VKPTQRDPAIRGSGPLSRTAGAPLAAEVNQGRWIVRCPYCPGAAFASEADPHFICNDCGNKANGYAWHPVTFPKAQPDIEAALDVREQRHQNWKPGETVAQLLAENAADQAQR
jgi:ribosomal protein L37AE/L43A